MILLQDNWKHSWIVDLVPKMAFACRNMGKWAPFLVLDHISRIFMGLSCPPLIIVHIADSVFSNMHIWSHRFPPSTLFLQHNSPSSSSKASAPTCTFCSSHTELISITVLKVSFLLLGLQNLYMCFHRLEPRTDFLDSSPTLAAFPAHLAFTSLLFIIQNSILMSLLPGSLPSPPARLGVPLCDQIFRCVSHRVTTSSPCIVITFSFVITYLISLRRMLTGNRCVIHNCSAESGIMNGSSICWMLLWWWYIREKNKTWEILGS